MKSVIKILVAALFILSCERNEPPEVPSNPFPADKSTGEPIDLTLKWECTDPDGDHLKYHLYFGSEKTPPLKAENLDTSLYTITKLDFNTTYYWKVIAEDEEGVKTEGPLWSFTTRLPPTGAIYVSSEPTGANIYLDEENTKKTTNALLDGVPVGEHSITLEKMGYADAKKIVTVVENETSYVHITLIRAGAIRVKSVPKGARVFLDGIDTGKETNCILPKVPVGNRLVELFKQGYQEWKKTITVTPDDTVTIEATLIPRYGSIQITSIPQGAEVYLNGENTGKKTNCVLTNVLEGKHVVTLKLKGYKDWEDTVEVYAGATTAVDAVLKGLGYIKVSSEPSGASVYLNNENLNLTTPCLIEDVVEGNHVLTLRLLNYRDWTKTIRVFKAETTNVHAELEHETGALFVTSTPKGAKIYLDGEDTGFRTDYLIQNIRTGTHTVRLELEGKFPCEGSVEIVVDQTTTFDTTLIPVEVGAYKEAYSAYGIAVSKNYAYLANGQEGLWIIDISTPFSPSLVSKLQVGDFVREIAVSGAYAYLGTWKSGLLVVNVENPFSPVLQGTCETPGPVQDIYIKDSYAYLADKQGGLRIIDVSSPWSPTEVGYYDTPGVGEGVWVSQNIVYFADGSNGLLVFDCSNPTSPVLIGNSRVPLYAIDVEVSKNYAFVCDWNSGLAIFDISNPKSPEKVRSFYSPGSAEDVALLGDYAYLADGVTGLRVIDCVSPHWPQEVGWEDTPGYARDIFIKAPFAFIADGDKGMRIIRIGW